MINVFEKTYYFNARFISTTNTSFNEHYKNKIKECFVSGNMLYFGDLRTSYIVKIEKSQNTFTFNTRNSVYVIEVIDGDILNNPDGILYIISDEIKSNIENELSALGL